MVLSVARAASMPSARPPAAAHARASRRASPRLPPRPAGAARVAMPPPSSISRVRSSASRRASSLRVRASDGGGAPSPSVADDEPATKRAPKPLDLATIPRPPLRLAAGLAAVGCVESSYLAFEKLTGGAVTCPLTGCQTALSSGYSVLFGVPLSAYGAAAYGLVAALAWWGAGMADAVFDVEDAGDDASVLLASPERRATADAYSKARALLCFSGFGLAGVSSYLLYVLAVPLGGAECVYCLTSAALSFSICAIGWSGLAPKQAASTAPAAVALYAVTALSCYVVIGGGAAKEEARASAANLQLPYAAPVIDNKSTAYSRDLAAFLTARGAKMYGAFWCSHCEDQKELFGSGAAVPYVECFPDGWQRGTPLAEACANVGITGFPTWVMPDGEKLEGDKALKELAAAAGFRAPPAEAADAAAQLDDLLG